MPVIDIDGRIKRLFSIHQKLKRQKIELDQVYDFVALRIVTQSVQGLLRARSASSTRPGRRCRAASRTSSRCRGPTATSRCTRRSISERGFPFEVQIRTAEMHRHRRGRHRGALEVQGRPRRRRARRAVLPLAAAAARVAAGGARSAGVPAEPEDRALPRGGLHLHAEGRGEGAAARRDAGRLRLRDPHRRRPPVRRRARQRQDGAAAHAPAQRRHRRDRHARRATSRAATG